VKEALKTDQSWEQFKEAVKDHTTQGDAYINFRRKKAVSNGDQKEDDEEKSVNAIEGKKQKWKPNPDIVCFGCGKKGHIKINCPKLTKKKKKSASKKKKTRLDQEGGLARRRG
jgi:6-phosphogluconolactonase/glucosamine-6-phosphate isomerase/deaminase